MAVTGDWLMRSIRIKTTLLTVGAIIISIAAVTLLSVGAIRKIGDGGANQLLSLLCETGQKNLDSYFQSVEQSVEMVSSFVESDITGLEPDVLQGHIDRVRAIFERLAYKTNGVLTYYYRIDPAVSGTAQGFWYANLDGEGFREREVTDISRYDTADTSKLVWFTVPKATGKPVWLPPYVTDNLSARVISYNVPIYWDSRFVGVIGIEIDYATVAEQTERIRLYDNGYAFIADAQGNLICHPRIDVAKLDDESRPEVPNGLTSDSDGAAFSYVFDGVEKLAVRLPLSNGMRLYVTVPASEINGGWRRLIYEISAVSVALLTAFALLATRFADRITKPLRELTEAAEQVNAGNYEIELNYSGNDEVGILTSAFRRLIRHLKTYIGDLSARAYADALTSVHNKGAFNIYVRDMEEALLHVCENPGFAVAAFDCDNLKTINDQYGHDKGDIYLKTASGLICRVFQHSPVFRIGGDEFAVILQNEDYRNRNALIRLLNDMSDEICASAENPWERTSVSMGIAEFNPLTDKSVDDVTRRADKRMYENKRKRKAAQLRAE